MAGARPRTCPHRTPVDAGRGRCDGCRVESIVGPVPVWLEPIGLGDWPRRPYESEKLRYATSIPEPWGQPEQKALPTHLEELFRGGSPCEGLLVQFMDGADPSADLRSWADAPLSLTGAPAVTAALAEGAKTLDWAAAEAPDSLNDRFRVDEVHLYEGLTQLEGGALSRVYALLARRGTLAWHVELALESACPPGAPLELVERTDHRRAGGTMGELRFG